MLNYEGGLWRINVSLSLYITCTHVSVNICWRNFLFQSIYQFAVTPLFLQMAWLSQDTPQRVIIHHHSLFLHIYDLNF